jgi:hypothetical protein
MSDIAKMSVDEVRAIVIEEFAKAQSAKNDQRSPVQLAIYNRLRENGEGGIAELFLIYDTMCMSMTPPKQNIIFNITGSTIGNAVFDSQVNTITASVNTVSQQGGDGEGFAAALKQLTQSVSQTDELSDSERKGLLDAFELVASQAQERPEKRKMTILQPVLDSLPKLLGSAVSLVTLWNTLGPQVLSFFK